MLLGDILQSRETLENEYKEFCVKTNIYNIYDTSEIINIVNNGTIDNIFNYLIDDNLQLYFNIYIPKYESAFYNSNIQNGNILAMASVPTVTSF